MDIFSFAGLQFDGSNHDKVVHKIKTVIALNCAISSILMIAFIVSCILEVFSITRGSESVGVKTTLSLFTICAFGIMFAFVIFYSYREFPVKTMYLIFNRKTKLPRCKSIRVVSKILFDLRSTNEEKIKLLTDNEISEIIVVY
jgi:hypothetical protein